MLGSLLNPIMTLILPDAWSILKEEGDQEVIVSDPGEQFESWKASLHSMIHLKRGQKVLTAIRRCMIQLEGWTESPLLPEGWIFKVLKVGVSGEARAFRSTSKALVLGDGLPHQGGGLVVLHGGSQGVHGEVAEVQL